MKIPPVEFQTLGLRFNNKNNFVTQIEKNLKASATLRYTVQTERKTKQKPLNTVYSILSITDSSFGVLLHRLGAKTKLQKTLLLQEN